MSCSRLLGRWRRSVILEGILKRNLHNLRKRGFIQEVFPPVAESEMSAVLDGTSAAYCGFDPTSDSLHLGNLLSILLLMQLQKKGIKPIAIVGEATAQIGDPSGRLTERQALSSQILERNVRGIEDDLRTVFSNHQRFFSPTMDLPELKILRNSSWYTGVELVRFLGTTGRHFRMGQMLNRESVKARLKSPEGLSLAEFSYQVFQAYDWLHLFTEYGCALQVGGQDQLGNIDAGHDLIRRVHRKNSFGLMTPLITAESGNKYGKTAGNALWLSPNKTSPYEMYQFLLRMSDTEAQKLASIFTFATDEELGELHEQHKAHPQERPLQKRMAHDITVLLHGLEELTLAQKASDLLFGNKLEILDELDETALRKIFLDTAYAEIPKEKLVGSYGVIDFSLEAKLFRTEADAKRIISAGGLYVNMRRYDSSILTDSCILSSGLTLARTGKKNYTLIKWI